MCRELSALQQSIADYAARFDVDSLVPSQAGEIVRACSRIEASISAIKALAVAKSAEGMAWKKQGYRSAADKLAQETGISPGAARRTVQTGERMTKQPDVAQAALAGELSAEQAEAVSDGVAANPDKAKELVKKAKELSLPELNEEVARTKAAATDLEARRKAIHSKRSLRRWTDREGGFHAHLYGNPETGIGLSRIIDPIRRRLVALRNAGDQPRESFEAIEHDALMIIAATAAGQDSELSITDLLDLGLFPQLGETLLARTATAESDPNRAEPDHFAGTRDPSDSKDAPAKEKRSKKLAGSAAKVIVRVDFNALLRGYPLDGELCEVKGLGTIPVSLIEELIATGNAFLAAVLMDGHQVVGVYHHGRRPTAYQKTALEFIYPECAAKGCNVRGGLQADHREDWAETHFTVVDLLDHLCTHHHSLKTREGWALVEGTGKRDFVPPADPRHPRHTHRSGADPPRKSA